MIRPRLVFQLQMVILIASVVLGFYHFLGYRRLTKRLTSMDSEMAVIWERVVNLNLKYRTQLGIDLATVTNSHALASKSVVSMQKAADKIRGRIELETQWREKLNQPFVLLDFIQTRARLAENIRQLSLSNKVEVATNALQFTWADQLPQRDKPACFWAQLFFYHQVLASAVASSPVSVNTLTLLPIRSWPPIESGHGPLEEYPMRVELTGSLDSMRRFLVRLPLLPAEISSLKLPVASTNKPAIFFQDLVIRSTLRVPDEVRLEAVVSGFVNRQFMLGASGGQSL